jgi:hypothetical protein
MAENACNGLVMGFYGILMDQKPDLPAGSVWFRRSEKGSPKPSSSPRRLLNTFRNGLNTCFCNTPGCTKKIPRPYQYLPVCLDHANSSVGLEAIETVFSEEIEQGGISSGG